MSVTIDGTLYHASWCGHCKNFLPEWNKFKQQIQSLNGKHKGIRITTHEYEDKNLPVDGATIKGEQIKGYPTLKITVTQNGKSNEIEYEGKRNAKELFWYVTEKAINE
jgi:thiol-disulfide isomerase/thioredoxin